MYRACIFDLDGTLTDTLESLTFSVNETLRTFSLPGITHEQCRSFVGSGAKVLMERALRAVGDESLSRLEEAMKVYGRIFQEYCTYDVTPYDGIENMLQVLQNRGMKLAVLSNKPHKQAVDVVTSVFGENLFSLVQGQMEAVPKKPDPTAVYAIVDELGVPKEECLYVGDSDIDMQTGQAAGMDTVGVTWGFRSKEVLRENGATYLIDQPGELIAIVEEKE